MQAAVTKPVETPDAQGQQAAFDELRKSAEALPEADVKVRGDTELALANAHVGVDAVLARRADLEKAWPKPRVEALADVTRLAQAAQFAATQAELADTSSGALAKQISEAYDNRDKLLSALDTSSKFGLVPAESVPKIREGRGSLDAAQDCVSLVALYRANAKALEHQTPVTPPFLARTEELGNKLVTVLRPGDAKQRGNEVAKAAAELANRYWTLLVNGHRELRKAGYELWGEGQDAHVPPLQSRAVSRKADAAAPATPPLP